MLRIAVQRSRHFHTKSRMTAPDDQPSMDAQPPREETTAVEQLQSIASDPNEHGERGWRAQLGEFIVSTQLAADRNFTFVRLGCVFVMAGSAYAAIRFSGLLGRFQTVDSIPSSHFNQRKTLRARVIRQSEQDPSILYVYHTPFWRRVLLQDTLPPVTRFEQKESLLAVRAFGIQVDECASEWIYANLASSNRYVTLKLLRRMHTAEDHSALATCAISLRRFPFKKDLAHELVSRGLADCLPEDVEQYTANGHAEIGSLMKRLQQLEAAQKQAQTMQYGIWKDWQDEKLTKRVLSAGRRVTSRGFQKLLHKVTSKDG